MPQGRMGQLVAATSPHPSWPTLGVRSWLPLSWCFSAASIPPLALPQCLVVGNVLKDKSPWPISCASQWAVPVAHPPAQLSRMVGVPEQELKRTGKGGSAGGGGGGRRGRGSSRNLSMGRLWRIDSRIRASVNVQGEATADACREGSSHLRSQSCLCTLPNWGGGLPRSEEAWTLFPALCSSLHLYCCTRTSFKVLGYLCCLGYRCGAHRASCTHRSPCLL